MRNQAAAVSTTTVSAPHNTGANLPEFISHRRRVFLTPGVRGQEALPPVLRGYSSSSFFSALRMELNSAVSYPNTVPTNAMPPPPMGLHATGLWVMESDLRAFVFLLFFCNARAGQRILLIEQSYLGQRPNDPVGFQTVFFLYLFDGLFGFPVIVGTDADLVVTDFL